MQTWNMDMDMVVAGASLIFATVYDTIGNVRGQEMLICTSVISGGSTSGLDETATKRSFARQTHLRARLLAVRLAR